MGRRKTGAGGRPLRVRENGNWFSERLPHMGERKKLVARISKSEPLILKSKPLIFCSLKTRPAGAGDQLPFGRISVCLLAPKMRTKHRHAPAGAGCRENIYPMIKINGNIVETRFIASSGLVYSAESISRYNDLFRDAMNLYEARFIAPLLGDGRRGNRFRVRGEYTLKIPQPFAGVRDS